MVLEPSNRGIEGSLLPSLDLGVRKITPDRESMVATLEMLSLVSRSKLAITKNLVSCGLRFRREQIVESAAVDEERCFRLLKVFLEADRLTTISILRTGYADLEVLGCLHEGRVADYHNVDLVLKGKVKDGPCWRGEFSRTIIEGGLLSTYRRSSIQSLRSL